MNNSPCKDCPNRRIACHAHCEIYLEYQKENIAQTKVKNAYLRRPTYSMSHEKSIAKNQRDYYRRRRH